MSLFEWERPVPPAWQADLAQLNPGEHVTSLHLSWLAGFPYEPVQRWVVYEVTPAKAIAEILAEEEALGIRNSFVGGLWQELRGPDPRTTGKWVPAPDLPGGQRWVSRSMVSRTQWQLHQHTGGLPLLCWIIEGSHGGHAWQFGPFEQSFLVSVGTAPELVQAMADAWPDPGSQAYADYDRRALVALADRDLLRQYRLGRPWTTRTKRTDAGLILASESVARKAQMMERMMRWLDNQIGEAVSDIPRRMLPQWSAFARDDTPRDEAKLNASLKE